MAETENAWFDLVTVTWNISTLGTIPAVAWKRLGLEISVQAMVFLG
jgi:hypothetical protein